MNAATIGALIGGAIGLVNFAILQKLANNISLKTGAPEKNKSASMLRIVAWLDLIIFPLAGYFIGPLVGS